MATSRASSRAWRPRSRTQSASRTSPATRPTSASATSIRSRRRCPRTLSPRATSAIRTTLMRIGSSASITPRCAPPTFVPPRSRNFLDRMKGPFGCPLLVVQSIPRRIVMNLRFVTRQVHAYLDYPVAVGLMALPFVLGLGVSNPAAKWLSVVTGAAAFVLTLLTNHELGVIKVLPYRFHVAVYRLVGSTFALAPIVLGFTVLYAAYYWANAAALLAVTFLFNSPERATLSSQPASSGVAKASVMAEG